MPLVAAPRQAASEGGRRSWWRSAVHAKVRGGYTLAPLEDFSLDSSPESLVTCIMKARRGRRRHGRRRGGPGADRPL
jgi:hypothetical protein